MNSRGSLNHLGAIERSRELPHLSIKYNIINFSSILLTSVFSSTALILIFSSNLEFKVVINFTLIINTSLLLYTCIRSIIRKRPIAIGKQIVNKISGIHSIIKRYLSHNREGYVCMSSRN